MNKYSLILFLVFSAPCFAQSNLLNAKTPADIGKKSPEQIKLDNLTPLKYGYLDDRDVLFGRKIWEFIDIDERVNFPLYYPLEQKIDRIPLFSVLREYVETSKAEDISKFCFQDEYFGTPLDLNETKSKFQDAQLTEQGKTNVNDNFNPSKIDMDKDPDNFRKLYLQLILDKKLKEGPDYKTSELTPGDITGYYIQGYWYFDARLSEMKYRLLAIAPVAISAKGMVDATLGKTSVYDEYEQMKKDQGTDLTQQQIEDRQKKLDSYDVLAAPDALFWVYYPAIREVLKKYPAFNERNSSKPISFDDLLVARRFHGMIYKEENTMEDRKIVDYVLKNSLGQLLESDRVKEKIRDLEHDMWTY